MSRILITGGSGYLGRRLVPLANERHNVVYITYQNDPLAGQAGRQLDLRDEAAVRRLVNSWRPEVIIHTAGSNRAPDSKTMTEVICLGAQNISHAATDVDARLIHLSTDALFSGRDAPYGEKDPPDPIHAYGRAKAAAEQIVSYHMNHVIVRTSLIYGMELMDASTSWITNNLTNRTPVTLFSNQLRNPIWVETLARVCLELAEGTYQGILHVAGRQALSRVEFGLRLLDWWGVSDRQTLMAGEGDGAIWPLDCRLDISLAQKFLETPLMGVDEVLALHRGD